ncbi:hypothetical protein HN747_02030 [archaeon]|jgi:hypothetical protein|nr:hypothetical protein [archaeon]
MKEKHKYESWLQFGTCHCDVEKVRDVVLKYFQNPDNATPVFEFHPEGPKNLWGYNSQGISVNIQTHDNGEDLPGDVSEGLYVMDVKLVSEVTPTRDLEDRVKSLTEPFRK